MENKKTKSFGQEAKQERERAEFENFLYVSGRSFDSFCSADEPEPDILAQKGSESYGVEITNFHRRDIKRRESEEDRVIKRALALYTEHDGPNLDVNVIWAPHYKIRKQDRNDLACRLASFSPRKCSSARQRHSLGLAEF